MIQSEETRDRILIRLEVEIPAGVAAPQIVVPTQAAPSMPHRQVRAAAYVANVPQPECRVPGTDRVRFSASGFASYMSLYGYPITAHGIVVEESVNPSYSVVDPGAKQVSVNAANGFYEFKDGDMPEAVVCCYPGQRFKLVVWLHYQKMGVSPPDKWTCEVSSAVPVDCTSLPDCASSVRAYQSPAFAIEQLAYQWHANVQGFEGREVKPLNGRWNLKVSDASGKAIIVDNSGEKAKVAARMCVDSAADACRLELRHRKVVATYGMPARAFSGAGKNEFRFESLAGADDKVSVPVCIVVSPA